MRVLGEVVEVLIMNDPKVTTKSYRPPGRYVRFVRFTDEDTNYDEVIVSAMATEYDSRGKLKMELREIARIDLVLKEVSGPSNFFTGGRPRGVPLEDLAVIKEYIEDDVGGNDGRQNETDDLGFEATEDAGRDGGSSPREGGTGSE